MRVRVRRYCVLQVTNLLSMQGPGGPNIQISQGKVLDLCYFPPRKYLFDDVMSLNYWVMCVIVGIVLG
jgi:hypothetical protein